MTLDDLEPHTAHWMYWYDCLCVNIINLVVVIWPVTMRQDCYDKIIPKLINRF